MIASARLAKAAAVLSILAMTSVAFGSSLAYQYDSKSWESLFTEEYDGPPGPLPVGPATNWALAGAGFNLDGAGNLRTPDAQNRTVTANSMSSLFTGAGITESDEWVYETSFNVHVGTHPIGGGIWPGYRYYTLMHGTSGGIAFKGSVDGPYDLQYRSSYSGPTPIAVIATGLARDTWYTAAIHRKTDGKVDFYLDGVLMLPGQSALSSAIPTSLWFGSATSAECAAVMDLDYMYIGTPPSTADLTIKKFFDCNLDNTKNGEDKYLSGWQFNVSNVGDGGTYNETHTTDANGEIVLLNVDPGQYDITETVKGTGWVLADANPRLVTVALGDNPVNFGNQLPGDANQDEKVNLADFTVLKAHFGEAPAGWTFGNFNDDTIVNLSDFTILKAYFGEGAPSAGGVPEPATLVLLGAAAPLLLKRKRS